jgi:predicted membrane chloride channel (bestrophin family)
MVRYMNAAHVSGYVGLSSVYPSGSFFRHLNNDLALLTDTELRRMKEIDLDKGGSCNRELVTWAMMEVQTAQAKGQIDSDLAMYLRSEICKLRAGIGELYNAKDLPIPFFYVHFICLLTVMYLPLFALTTALNIGTEGEVHWLADVVAGLVVFLQSIFVIGLRILGQQFSDPFGEDLVDLAVLQFCTFIWTHSQRILNSTFPDEPGDLASAEEELAKRRISIGAPWERRVRPEV